MNPEQEKIILAQADYRCAKCGFYSPVGNDLEVIYNTPLCSICSVFAPEQKDKFEQYVEEKAQWQNLESFRKFGSNKASHNPHRKAMVERAKEGRLMARPAFGYKVKKGNLILDEENSENVRLIFQEFSGGKSLNQISKTYGISVNGIKKILHNFTYLGKIKFAGQIVQGHHPPIISSELFNNVQRRFEELKKKRVQDF